MIIDAHSHWLPDEIILNAHFYHKGWGDIESHLRMMEDAGIAKAVLSYPASDAHLKLGGNGSVARIFNDNAGGILKRYPDKFIGAAVLPADNAARMQDELARAVDELGFRAISMASSYNGDYLDDPRFHPVYKIAQARRLPIFVHAQIVNPIGSERVGDPLLTPVIEYIFDITMCVGRLLTGGILRDYPGLNFVFANFGGAIPFLRHRFDATYRMLRGINLVEDLGNEPSAYLKNICVDTGGDAAKTSFLPAIDFLGARHVLWGSDWPAKKDAAGSIRALRELHLSDGETEGMLGGNALRLLEDGI